MGVERGGGEDSEGGEGGGGGGEGGVSVRVQFMWQPLTEITYPHVTLLASFKVSVTMPVLASSHAHNELLLR